MNLIKFHPLVLEATDPSYSQLTLKLKDPPKKYNKYVGYKGGIVRVEKIENSNNWMIIERKAGMYPYVFEKLGNFKDKDTAQTVLDRWAQKNGRRITL